MLNLKKMIQKESKWRCWEVWTSVLLSTYLVLIPAA